jgi:hypothetical protein
VRRAPDPRVPHALTKADKHDVNAHVLGDFVVRLGSPPRIDAADGWIIEGVTVRGDGTWLPLGLPVRFAKLVTGVPALAVEWTASGPRGGARSPAAAPRRGAAGGASVSIREFGGAA